MSADVEYDGKNVKDALLRAGSALGLPVGEIQYEIISHGSTGIFGLVGIKKARIRIIDYPVGVGSQSPVKENGNRSTAQTAFAKRVYTADITGDQEGIVSYRNEDREAEEQLIPCAEITEEIIARSRAVLGEIIKGISDGTTITGECIDGRLVLNLGGGNTGALIGKRGQTLEAIHYLVEKIMNKGREDRIRVLLDVEGYLENRRCNLRELANRMAEKAKRKGRPTTIGQMNAHDRRIIHLALKDDHTVRTQSIGEGHLRKLIIYPKNPQHKHVSGRKSDAPRSFINT